MKILKTILSHKPEKLSVFDRQRVVLAHGFDVISNSICSLNCQYAQPMHIIGKVSQPDFYLGSYYSNGSYRLLLAPATSDEFLDPFSLQETQTPMTP